MWPIAKEEEENECFKNWTLPFTTATITIRSTSSYLLTLSPPYYYFLNENRFLTKILSHFESLLFKKALPPCHPPNELSFSPMFSNSHLSNTLWRTFHAPPNYIRRINTKKNRYIIYILSTKKIGWWVKGHTNHYLLRFLTFSFVKKSKTKRICYIYIIVHRKYWPYFYSLVIIQKKHSKQRIIFCLVKTWFSPPLRKQGTPVQ